MNFQLDEDTVLLRDSVRELGKQRRDDVLGWGSARSLPAAWITELAASGLLALEVPEAQGGAGLSGLASMLLVEELAAFDASSAFVVAVHNVLGLACGQYGASLPADALLDLPMPDLR